MESAPWIFLSYRRSNGGTHLAARVRTALETVAGAGSVFLDLGAILGGSEWDDTIREGLQKCLATVLVIDPNWTCARLHDSADWVRREIEESLRHKRFILPLLIDGGSMPQESELPESLKRIATRQGYFVDSRSEKLFSAAMRVVSEELMKRFTSSIVLERNGWPNWPVRNTWEILTASGVVVHLAGSASSASGTLSPGRYELVGTWDEQGEGSMIGTKYADYGFSSSGRTQSMALEVRPGTYSFTFRLMPKPGPKTLWDRFLDWGGRPNQSNPRRLEQVAFAPARDLAGD